MAPSSHCATCACFRPSHSLSHPSPWPEHLDPLVAELADAKAHLVEVEIKLAHALRHRNALVPVSRLPSEILADIFLYCRSASPGALKWISVSHTHHSWREAALSCGILWNSPDPWRPQLAMEMIRRARGAELHLTLRHPRARKEPLTSFNTDKLDGPLSLIATSPVHESEDPVRVRSIDIQDLSPSGHSKYWDFLRTSAPSVQTVRLHVSAASALPSDVTALEYPSLRSLYISLGALDWSCSLLRTSSLRSLELEALPISSGSPQVSWRNILHTLGLLTELRELLVKRSLPIHVPQGTSMNLGALTVHLDKLEFFCVSASTDACALLLEHMRFPSTCSVQIHTPSLQNIDKVVHHAFASLPPCIYGLRLNLSGGKIKIFASEDIVDPHFLRYIQVDIPSRSEESFIATLRCISTKFLVNDQDTVCLVITGSMTEDMMRTVLSSCPVTTLHLDWSLVPVPQRLPMLRRVSRVLREAVAPNMAALVISGFQGSSVNDLADLIESLESRTTTGIFRTLRFEDFEAFEGVRERWGETFSGGVHNRLTDSGSEKWIKRMVKLGAWYGGGRKL